MSYLNYARHDVAQQCSVQGATLVLPANLSGAQVMWALAGIESSFGANCKPRHEAAYDRGGLYDHGVQALLLNKWGTAAANSYGPWQVMLANAGLVAPDVLATDIAAAAKAARNHIQKWCVDFRKAQTLEQIAQAYNAGNFYEHPGAGLLRYTEAVRHFYDSETLPELEVA